MRIFMRAVPPVVMLMLVSTLPGSAQTHRASVRGVVLDPTGAAVPQVTLNVTNEANGDVQTVTTEADGRFAVVALPSGPYRIEVERMNYKKYVSRTNLQVNQELWLEVRLELGSVTEEVLVVAPVVPLEKESPALGTVIDSPQLSSLPLDGRNFLELSLLAPGVAPAPEGSASSLRGDFALTVNGGREDAQSFLLDGVYNMDPKLNTPGVRPPVDAIREFEVLTSTYDASFGRNAAGQINVVTHSGGNALHGTAYAFFRTHAMDARNYFAPADEPAPDYSRGQYGASIGGPIRRDRTFFFADYEHLRQREGLTQITNVPTLAERNGDFSQSFLPPPVIPGTMTPFPGGVIPSFSQNPIGQAIAALYPAPNRSTPGANFVSSPTLRDDVDHFDVRLDHKLSDASSLMARYSFNDRRFFEPFASAVAVPGYGTDVPRRGQNLAIGYTHAFGPALVNEFRFGYGRVSIGVFQENQGTSINQQVGMPELSSDPRDWGLSQIAVTGFSPLGDEFTTPQESATDTVDFSDAITWARGPHMFKFGGGARHIAQKAYRDVQSRGFINFLGAFTFNPLADLLLGLPTFAGGAILDNPQNLRAWSYNFFAQDEWRLLPNLTFTLGLRYEYIGPAFDADDRANLYDPATGQLVPVGAAGVPRGGYAPDRNNWAPRVGIAWTPDSSGQTVIRGGYGIYYNQGALATGEGLYFNAPFFDFSLYFPNALLPPLTVADPFATANQVPFPSATAFQPDLQTGWLEQWSVSIQRQLGRTRAIEFAYVGSRGHDLIAARDINQAPAQPTPPGVPNLRPNPLFQDITSIESRGRSNYNAFQAKFQQRFDRGVSLLSVYTFGKSLDDASGFFASAGDANFPQDSNNPEAEYARSSFDVAHRFSLSFGWQLPFGPGRRWASSGGVLSAILGDAELQGIVTLQSGRPFTVALPREMDNSNTGLSSLGFGSNDRPNVTGDPSLDDPTPDRWFNTSAFSLPAFGSFGNAPRNLLEGPGYQNVNLALLKGISLSEQATLQVRIEAYNLFNRVNFNLPDGFLGSPTFGRVTSADSPRRCQFGLRLIF
jgi:outer membrane receptor protein involved in Fe transport